MGPILVVGAGPAGIAAACALAARGERPLWIEQGQAAGGAFHRQPLQGVQAVPLARAARAQWRRLAADMGRHGLSPKTGCVFLGIDGEGCALFEDRQSGHVSIVRPRAVIAATGAVERVRPVDGWTRPGVMAAGALQLMLKTTGTLPPGRILLAGNGPLLVALAAQMTTRGRPPVAVIERAVPRAEPRALLALAARPGVMAEAAGYAARLVAAGVRWQFGAAIRSIVRTPEGLVAEVEKGGHRERIVADVIGLHDGIRTNDFGLPGDNDSPVPVIRAGDCRETLGWLAAERDGGRAAAAALDAAALAGSGSDALLARERTIQTALQRLFAPAAETVAGTCADGTVLCRCENRTFGELKTLLAANPGMNGREIKLNGRFAMGACQGRFCADSVLAAIGAAGGTPSGDARSLTGARWPIRPVTIAALLQGPSSTPDREED